MCVLYRQMFCLALVTVIEGSQHTWCVNAAMATEDDHATDFPEEEHGALKISVQVPDTIHFDIIR